MGKHKGKWFTDVCDTDPEYVEWAADLQTPSSGMKKFTAFAQKRAAEELEQRTTKKQRGDKDKDCCICWTAPVGCVFVPCGHLVTCQRCSSKVAACPVCRQEINLTVKVFT